MYPQTCERAQGPCDLRLEASDGISMPTDQGIANWEIWVDHMKLTRRTFIASAASLAAVQPAFAKNVPELNLSRSGLALRGVDPVSYFVSGEPQKGSRKLALAYKGGTYRFANEENMKAFQQNPDKYLPAYGGYCAYGTAVNAKVDGDPYIWHIIDDQLYLNITRSVDRVWRQDIPGYIEDADRNWEKIKFQAP